MSKILFGAALAGLSLFVMADAAMAGPIESACVKADRNAASRALCGCIQRVADVTLSRGDQRLAATFFKNPDKAQDVRMSQSRRDDEFWDRYTVFTQQAGMACQG